MRVTTAWIGIPVLGAALFTQPAVAQSADSAAFVVRLGLDTTAVERYVKTGNRIEAISVTRSPRTAVRRLSVWLADDGSVARFAVGAGGEMREAIPAAPGIPLVGGFYLPWELALQRAFRAGAEETTVNMLSGSQPVPIPFRTLAEDRFAFANQFDQPIRARTDRAGRLQYLEIQGGGATVERVAWMDIDALQREFASRDAASTGLGPLSPFDSVMATLCYQAQNYLTTGEEPRRLGNRHPSLAPYETFESADGYLTLAVGNDSLWQRFCQAVDKPDLNQDRFKINADRVKNYEALRAELEALFKTAPTCTWVEKLDAAGIPVGQVRSIAEVFQNPQVEPRRMAVEVDHPTVGRLRLTGNPIKMSGAPEQDPSPPPVLGEHTEEILQEKLGLDRERIEMLRGEGAIKTRANPE
jgi:hypothetical protein